MPDVTVPWWAVAAVAAGLLLVVARADALVTLRGRRRAAPAGWTPLTPRPRRCASRSRRSGADGSSEPRRGPRTSRQYVITGLRARRDTALGAPSSTSRERRGHGAGADVRRDRAAGDRDAAASLAAGLRRALSPEVRDRIRFEMRREVKRARKQRRPTCARRAASGRRGSERDVDLDEAGRRDPRHEPRRLVRRRGRGRGLRDDPRPPGRRGARPSTACATGSARLVVGARMFRDEVAQGRADAESELRERLGLVPHGTPNFRAGGLETGASAPSSTTDDPREDS